ncbi:ATP-binding cassette glutathione S-conjugate transporter ycf1 [Coemansia sp. RSA 1365]|nr:ATP-binding cassette glutathione S-conjugate transporter ycf1 [Coemansia sp. RSA 1365]
MATQKWPATLSSRLIDLLPSTLSFKILAFEDAVFSLKPGDHFDDHTSLMLGTLVSSVAKLARGAGVYLTFGWISGAHTNSGFQLDFLQLLSSTQSVSASCGELVEYIGVFANLKQLEHIIGKQLSHISDLSAGTTISKLNAKGPAIKMYRSIFKRDNTEDISLSVERLHVRPGQLVAVTGAIGAGKSTFLLALLNELKLVSGTSRTSGSTAYVGQIPWIMGSSLKENIMFGKVFDEALYAKTLAICCLEKDIDGMNDKDSTIVSDQGTTLSGGQRARVALARAFYAEADIYVLDDTLAALDAIVQASIWNNMLSNQGALRNKIRIIATNDRKYIENCDIEVNIVAGRACVVKQLSKTAAVTKTEPVDTISPNLKLEPSVKVDGAVQKQTKAAPNSRKWSAAVEKSSQLQAIYYYIKLCGTGTLVFAVVMGLVSFALPTILRLRRAELLHSSIDLQSHVYFKPQQYAYMTAIHTIAEICLRWIKLATQEWVFIAFNRPNLQNALLHSFSRMKMSELWNIDEYRLISVARCSERATLMGIHSFVTERAEEFASIAMSVYSTYKVSTTALAMSIGVGIIVANTGKHIGEVLHAVQWCRYQKLEAHKKITYDLFSGSLTVRVFRNFDFFGNRIRELNIVALRIERLATAIIDARSCMQRAIQELIVLTLVGIMILKTGQDAGTDAAAVQLYHEALFEALPFLSNLFHFRNELNNHLKALQEFCDKANLAAEGPRHIQGLSEIDNWPQHGSIQFSDCCLRYNSDEGLALNSVSFQINPGEHIGIVGRTGSGKSSLINALFRIVELESGIITIDGLNISQIGLHDLRKHIGAVPQTAALFEGTLRKNLDPFDKYTEVDIIAAIRDARLDDLGPDKWIKNCGINLSAGQQQLISICRVILRRRKIVVFDEATASIDAETARLVKSIVNDKLKGSTFLTIAHRLEDIMDSDRILVMNEGRVAEFGTPEELIAKKGLFYKIKLANDSST